MALSDKNASELAALNSIVALLLGTVADSSIEDPTGIVNDLTLTSSTETTSGTVAAGKRSVMFTCIDGTEIINGVVRVANQVIIFEWSNRRTPVITWDADGGTIQLDILE